MKKPVQYRFCIILVIVYDLYPFFIHDSEACKGNEECTTALFNISDSIYGTNFYSVTGLHGLHIVFAVLV
jgi:hypothetical protein